MNKTTISRLSAGIGQSHQPYASTDVAGCCGTPAGNCCPAQVVHGPADVGEPMLQRWIDHARQGWHAYQEHSERQHGRGKQQQPGRVLPVRAKAAS